MGMRAYRRLTRPEPGQFSGLVGGWPKTAIRTLVEATGLCGLFRNCSVESDGLGEVATWIAARRKVWNDRFEALDTVLETLMQKEAQDGQA